MEQPTAKIADEDLLRMTTEVVAAYVGNNSLTTAQLPEVINAVYASLKQLDGKLPDPRAEPLRPAVPVRKSVTPDYLVCLEDGKKLKMLKRHLMTAYGMTPEQYREKWDLPPEYPMVAPNYAAKRSELARKIGLGAKGGRRRKR